MSVSGSRSPVDIDLDDFEKRLRTAGTPAHGIEDPLAELARLVEASRPKTAEAAVAPPAPAPLRAAAPVMSPPPVVADPEPEPEFTDSAPPLEAGDLRPGFDEATDVAPEVVADLPEPEEQPYPVYPPGLAVPPEHERPRSRRWLLTVSVLAIAGVAMIGAVFALKGGVAGLSKAPPFIAAADGPTKVQPPSDATVSAPSDAGASLLKGNTDPGQVKLVDKQEQPVDLNAQTSQPPAIGGGSGVSNPSTGSETHPAGDAPVVVTPPPPAPPAAAAFSEPKPVRTVSLRPDGTPIPASAADAAPAAAPAEPTPAPPAKAAQSAAKTTGDAASAQSSTPKIELPTKLSGKSSARVVVGKTDTTAPGDASGGPVQLGGAARAEKAAKVSAQEASAEAAAPAAAEPATASGGWAVQLAAPRSEDEAKSVMDKLKSKYASALSGSGLGVHKATVHGSTIYRVRVTGLTKADAAALCARIKGDGGQCFVAK